MPMCSVHINMHTHTHTHSSREDRYSSRCATLMTAPWWERLSAVEHMTVKGSVLSLSQCYSGMPGLGDGSCWTLENHAETWTRPPGEQPAEKNRCPAHDATDVSLGGDNQPQSSSSCSVSGLMSQWPLRNSRELLGHSVLMKYHRLYELTPHGEFEWLNFLNGSNVPAYMRLFQHINAFFHPT